MAIPFVARWWRELDRPGWRSFAIAMVALGLALLLALYSGAAAQTGRLWLAGTSALAALALAGWVAVTIVPALARRTPLRWLADQMDYKVTREGLIYLAGVAIVALAALNTGNNLLFLVLACLLAGIVVSGVLSRMVLTGIELRVELPEHVFAAQPVAAGIELRNDKRSLPSFSLRVVGEDRKSRAPVLSRPVYFPYVPRHQAVRLNVELLFPRRGLYRQESFGIRSGFPFGFLQKTRRVKAEHELLVYPSVSPTEEFYEILPMVSGELESYSRGRGHDLYSIRDYQPTDSARHVDWKASAKTATLKVREFTREDERRVVLVLDPFQPPAKPPAPPWAITGEQTFERAVTLCACLAWHFYEIDAVLGFRTEGFLAPLAPAGEAIYDVLRYLALIEPLRAAGGARLLASLAGETEVFKIILTSQPRGSIPTALWTSSYLIFLDAL